MDKNQTNSIEPKILKGFRDFLPTAELRRQLIQERLTGVFRSFGFVPIDTPVLEYSEILLRKSEGETEKQVFRFNDNGGRDVALRFDLTVPFARFVALHRDEISLPFKRYHIAKVWRGEKPQVGRYREFMQCDFDCVGSDSPLSDFEILQLMHSAFEAMGVGGFKIKVNHRGVFNRFLAKNGLGEKSENVLRAVDKLAKNGEAETRRDLSAICGDEGAVDAILDYIVPKSDFAATLEHIETLAGGECGDTKRLRDVFALLDAAGISQSFVLDPSITRGLDYYTGIVCETFLDALPSIGSVCSGGRYDNLASLYMKENISGVGASIGLDRLVAALEEIGIADSDAHFVDAAILNFDGECAAESVKLAAELRKNGVAAEVFGATKKSGQQYKICEAKKIPFAVLLQKGDAAGRFRLKDLRTREEATDLTADEIAAKILKSI